MTFFKNLTFATCKVVNLRTQAAINKANECRHEKHGVEDNQEHQDGIISDTATTCYLALASFSKNQKKRFPKAATIIFSNGWVNKERNSSYNKDKDGRDNEKEPNLGPHPLGHNVIKPVA